jgi:hypothetical protein
MDERNKNLYSLYLKRYIEAYFSSAHMNIEFAIYFVYLRMECCCNDFETVTVIKQMHFHLIALRCNSQIVQFCTVNSSVQLTVLYS